MISSMLALVMVCTVDNYTGNRQCYDTMFESPDVIRCDDYSWNQQPFPWEWSRGRITLGYFSTVTGKYEVNHSFYYEWGGWWLLSGNNYEYVLGIDTGPDGAIFGSSMEGNCGTEPTGAD